MFASIHMIHSDLFKNYLIYITQYMFIKEKKEDLIQFVQFTVQFSQRKMCIALLNILTDVTEKEDSKTVSI